MVTTTLKLGSHLSGLVSLCLLILLFSLKVLYLQNALVLQNRKADELSILCMDICVSIILMIVHFFLVLVFVCFCVVVFFPLSNVLFWHFFLPLPLFFSTFIIYLLIFLLLILSQPFHI